MSRSHSAITDKHTLPIRTLALASHAVVLYRGFWDDAAGFCAGWTILNNLAMDNGFHDPSL